MARFWTFFDALYMLHKLPSFCHYSQGALENFESRISVLPYHTVHKRGMKLVYISSSTETSMMAHMRYTVLKQRFLITNFVASQSIRRTESCASVVRKNTVFLSLQITCFIPSEEELDLQQVDLERSTFSAVYWGSSWFLCMPQMIFKITNATWSMENVVLSWLPVLWAPLVFYYGFHFFKKAAIEMRFFIWIWLIPPLDLSARKCLKYTSVPYTSTFSSFDPSNTYRTLFFHHLIAMKVWIYFFYQ